MMHVPEQYRLIMHPIYGSTSKDGNNGAFIIPRSDGRTLLTIVSNGDGWELAFPDNPQKWEHVSVSIRINNKPYTPRWEEMCFVKDLFWDEEDVVIQFHPKKSEYVNCHPHTLHLWRPIGFELPMPPKETVGPTMEKK